MCKCPFGNESQKYWDNRYNYFSKFDEGIQIDAQGLVSVTPEKIALKQASRIKVESIVDGLGGVGGNLIAFAKTFNKVYFIENDPVRFNMAKNNAKIYGVEDKITFICGNFFEEIKKIKSDTVFLDPSWGGANYRNLEKFKLNDFNPNCDEILNLLNNKFKTIVLKIPLNFDLNEINKYQKDFELYNELFDEKVIMRTIYIK